MTLAPRHISRAAVVVLAALFIAGAGWVAQSAAGDADRSITLTVDYGDGVTKTIRDLAWAKGETVLDAMKAATARSHGISFSFTGSGDTAVLTRIDDVQNEGGGAAKKNWQYWVGDVYGSGSFGAVELKANDVVLWRFTTEQKK